MCKFDNFVSAIRRAAAVMVVMYFIFLFRDMSA
jgi:hypothetical protein